MSVLFNTALMGLQTNASGIQVVAQNVANLNTDGFRSLRFDPASGSVSPRLNPPSVEPGHTATALPPSNVDLATELIHLKQFEIGYRANAVVVRLADQMTGELLDLFG